MFITFFASRPSASMFDALDTYSIYLRADNSVCYTKMSCSQCIFVTPDKRCSRPSSFPSSILHNKPVYTYTVEEFTNLYPEYFI